MREPVLETRDVVVLRSGRIVLDTVSVAVPRQGVTCVVGPSGSGKSTLLRLFNRLLVPDAGQVLFDGSDVAGLDPLRLRRQVGMVFQRATPFAGTVADNLRVAAPSADDAAVARALHRCGLDDSFAARDARELSGGEGQRVCLARTLITGPRVLLADEPTSALDGDAVAAVETSLTALAGEGMTVVWVSHDPVQVDRVADHVIRLKAGDDR